MIWNGRPRDCPHVYEGMWVKCVSDIWGYFVVGGVYQIKQNPGHKNLDLSVFNNGAYYAGNLASWEINVKPLKAEDFL